MRFWTSDHHFGHDNIIGFANRPWSDVDQMNEAMIEAWNGVVTDEDDVIVVGDFALGVQRIVVPAVGNRLNGNKFLVPGNHDSVHRMYPHWKKSVHIYEDAGFTILGSQEVVNIGDVPVLVCHFPYDNPPDGHRKHDDRFSGLRPTPAPGQWLIHGHTHSHHVISGSERTQIHVGVDAWDYTPIPESWIEAIIKERP